MISITLQGMKLRIYPNEFQKEQIQYNFGANRFVWNQMLAMSIKRYENNPNAKFLGFIALNYLLKPLKQEYPWLKKADSTSLQMTNRHLVEAYRSFFSKVSGFPKFKSKKRSKNSYQMTNIHNNIRIISQRLLKLPKLGIVKFGYSKIDSVKIKSVTISKSSTDKYYAVLLVDNDLSKLGKTNKTIGLDMGVADLIICSNGTKYKTIRFDKILSKKKLYWEKRVSRRRIEILNVIKEQKAAGQTNIKKLNEYSNYTKAKRMVAKYSEKISNQRKDYINKITKELVIEYDFIVIEDLKTKNLLKNHKLSRAISNQSWNMIRNMLIYKSEFYGKRVELPIQD